VPRSFKGGPSTLPERRPRYAGQRQSAISGRDGAVHAHVGAVREQPVADMLRHVAGAAEQPRPIRAKHL
jgi:hypothetical protein